MLDARAPLYRLALWGVWRGGRRLDASWAGRWSRATAGLRAAAGELVTWLALRVLRVLYGR